ncbi:hypothetical protein T440DRAFT_389092 [Plenodomus tracheiphilus IPT5]|uniref:Rhodopsin domain-containing protein n=1 Tax=Plenodomus tracheiphilus IPT5 TaxID=1408161 RepID=A0A6A7BEP8_9PLEO|nr:hypothetical protein T440DRAFT_389092 [Plenodomus tracheiphilus IPT5]
MSSQTPPSEDVVLFGGVAVDISQFDFTDRSSRVASLRIVNIVLIVCVLSVVGLRIFARLKYVQRIFADDVLIIFATVFTIGLASTCIAATYHGLGTHVWVLPTLTIIESMKNCILYLYVCQILYAFAIASTKIAIISSYLRFIQHKGFRMTMYVIAMIVIGQWITGVLVPIFQCSPVAGAWDFTIPRKCIDYISYLYASSAVNVLTDILLCVLPMPHLWRLNMPLKQRIILCMLFAGGASACIVSIVRIGFLHTLRVMDTSYQSVPTLILSVAECSLSIISVSIPALRPLAQRFFPSAMRTHASSSNPGHSWHVRLGNMPPNRVKPTSKADNPYSSNSQESLTRDLA